MHHLLDVVRKHFLWIISVVIVGGIFAYLYASSSPMPLQQGSIPMPFGSELTGLQGALTLIGKRNGIDVYEVTYTSGEISETLLPDNIYLVHIPNADDIVEASLDAVFSAVTSNGRNINYYGYKYTDADASVERRELNAFLFKERFPGEFFASKKARDEDVQFGNMLAEYETANDIVFRKTDGTEDSVFLDSEGSLFVFVVNEDTGARLHVRKSGVCGNGVLEPTEECDDGNTVTTDACTNICRYGIPIPFGSGATAAERLRITVEDTAQNANALYGETGATLLRFAAAALEDVRLTKISTRASEGSLANAEHFSLWADTDGDSTVDTIVQDDAQPVSGQLIFNAIGEDSDGQMIPRGESVIFEIVADIVDAPISDQIQLELSLAGSTSIAAVREANAAALSGISIDGVCPVATCQIGVVTNPSIVWHLVSSAVCGDTIIHSGEECDEGDANGTVCSPTPGSSCTYCSLSCAEVTLHGSAACGNGVLDGQEICDDGNSHDGDGCSSACETEDGYVCEGEPSECREQEEEIVCGDGVIADPETCDDANADAGDGCSDACTIESGFFCGGTPSVCHMVPPRPLTIISAPMPENASATPGTQGIVLQRFTAITGDHDILLTNLEFIAERGSLDNIGAVTLWRDSDDDGMPDQNVFDFPPPANGVLYYRDLSPVTTHIIGGDQSVVFELRADAALTPATVPTLAVGFRTETGLYVGAQDAEAQQVLSNIETDGVCASTCDISVITTPTTLWTFESVAQSVCGNGAITGSETCDDQNTANGDGCSSVCSVEFHYRCIGEPSVCQSYRDYVKELADTNNNDRVSEIEALILTLDLVEAPDQPFADVKKFDIDNDGDVDNTDITLILAELDALTEPDEETPTACSNGVQEAGEQCDDQNTANGDGCSSSCSIEPGYGCTGSPSVCTHVDLPNFCGNGDIDTDETCDDGNQVNGDGCSSACRVESGYSCVGSPSVCTPMSSSSPASSASSTAPAAQCGNGAITGSETCDDQNTANGDGCSSVCAIEPEYRCTGEPSVCISYLDYVRSLADTNRDGSVSETEALLLTFDVVEAPDQPYDTVARFDIDLDGVTDNHDITIFLTLLDALASE